MGRKKHQRDHSQCVKIYQGIQFDKVIENWTEFGKEAVKNTWKAKMGFPIYLFFFFNENMLLFGGVFFLKMQSDKMRET